MTRRQKSPETFHTELDAMHPSHVTADDITQLRNRIAAQPDADLLLEALGFTDYPIVQRLDHTGGGVRSNARPKPGVRGAIWGEL